LTNSDGRFVLTNVPEGERTIRAVLIGYGQEEQTVTVTAGQTATVDLALRPSAVDIDAVVVSVVTGRAERRRELGTNTASISAQDLEVAPITKMADVLVGRAAGVTMQGVAGSVGTSQRIRIRGANSISLSNEPLIFVDGIQVSNSKGGIAVGGLRHGGGERRAADHHASRCCRPDAVARVHGVRSFVGRERLSAQLPDGAGGRSERAAVRRPRSDQPRCLHLLPERVRCARRLPAGSRRRAESLRDPRPQPVR